MDINNTLYSLNHQQEERHTQEFAERLKMPYADLSGYPFTDDILEVIPADQILRYKVMPFLKIGKNIKIGLLEPTNQETLNYLKSLEKPEGVTFIPSVISNSSFLYGMYIYQKRQQQKQQSPGQQTALEKDNLSDQIKNLVDVGKAAATVNVTKTFDVIMIGAIKVGASDVHLEPGESEFLVRYRIDGVLKDAAKLPMTHYKGLLQRIKFSAKMKMDKIGEPQDGRFSITLADQRVDLRVATMPSAYGEGVVIRLLSQDKSMQRLERLGFRPDALAIIRQAITRPHGMILNTGPTGSGKTTTLYAILLEVRKPGIKIITLEDPIEYRIEGVEQSQVDPEGSYTFADGLRGTLRADPDVIMVGEIRDTETAQIAVQAALTGHLLLSTVHANSAPAVYTRLLDIGVKPFLLAGSLNLIMAQRLVRTICPKCVEEYQPPEPIWQEIKQSLLPILNRLDDKIKQRLNGQMLLKRGRGCTECANDGFVGRQAIIEVLKPNTEIETLVARQATQAEFFDLAVKQGMITMEQDGLIKVLEGITTPEEVWRVTKDN